MSFKLSLMGSVDGRWCIVEVVATFADVGAVAVDVVAAAAVVVVDAIVVASADGFGNMASS